MRTILLVSLGLFASSFVLAQAPDVRIRGDLTIGLITPGKRDVAFRAYSPLGRFSTVSLQTVLPIGLKVNLAQRVSNLPGDADSEPFDEYFVEDPGSWRIGKQYLPFGGGVLFRETAKAARVDSSLIVEGLPLAFALVEQGTGRQQGAIGRLGSRGLGISAAVGRHWGINGTALSTLRPIGSGLGLGKGWKQAYSIDWNRRFGKVTARFEGLLLRQPETTEGEPEFFDTSLSYDLGYRHSCFLGLAKELGNTILWWRLGGIYTAQKGVQVETMLRTRSGEFVDFTCSLRVRF
jgi:hypothetical protein